MKDYFNYKSDDEIRRHTVSVSVCYEVYERLFPDTSLKMRYALTTNFNEKTLIRSIKNGDETSGEYRITCFLNKKEYDKLYNVTNEFGMGTVNYLSKLLLNYLYKKGEM